MPKPLVDPGKIEALKRAHEAYNANHIPYWLPEYEGNIPKSHKLYQTFMRAATDVYEEPLLSALESFFRGEVQSLDVIVRFLEEDPFYFRSGYLKAEILQRLKKANLSSAFRKRLANVCLRVVDHGDRREFRKYCQLAAKVADRTLITSLSKRIRSEDADLQRRASWMLEGIRRHGSEEFRD